MSLKAWETTGVDVSRDRIVELAATQGHDLAHLPGASFSEVVRVPEEIQRSASAQAAAAVHGITDEEIADAITIRIWCICRRTAIIRIYGIRYSIPITIRLIIQYTIVICIQTPIGTTFY